jgi:hypothetical protein
MERSTVQSCLAARVFRPRNPYKITINPFFRSIVGGRTAEARRHVRNTSARRDDEALVRDRAWPHSTRWPPRRGDPLRARALASPHPDSSMTDASNSTTIRSSGLSGPSHLGARTICSRARTVAAFDGQPSAPSSPPQSSTTSSPFPGSETSCSG